MPRLLRHIREAPRPCSYLPDQMAVLEHRVMFGVSPQELEALLERGWRRFGPTYFRPACRDCLECVSIRIPVSGFTPSKSQLRAKRRFHRFRAVFGPPVADEERLALYALWHKGREASRAWAPSPMDDESYESQFAFPHPAARELAFYEEGPSGRRLVALGLR